MGIPQTILIIDDDREISSTLNNVLSAAGYQVLMANNGLEGRKQIDSQNPDLVITDMMMPKMGGFPILEHINDKEEPPKVIMITANEGSRHKAYAEHLGAVDYLRKPFSMEVLLETVEKQIGKACGDEADGAAVNYDENQSNCPKDNSYSTPRLRSIERAWGDMMYFRQNRPGSFSTGSEPRPSSPTNAHSSPSSVEESS